MGHDLFVRSKKYIQYTEVYFNLSILNVILYAVKAIGFPMFYFLHLEILSFMKRKLKFKASKYNIKMIRIHA